MKKTIAKWFSAFVLLMLTCVSSAVAQNYRLEIANMDLAPGETKSATISLVNPDGATLYGLQADVELPEGITAKNIKAVDGILADGSNATLSTNVKGQTLKIALYSFTSEALKADAELSVVTLDLTAADNYVNVNGEVSAIKITNTVLTISTGGAETTAPNTKADVDAGVDAYNIEADGEGTTVPFNGTAVTKGIRTYAKNIIEGEVSGMQPVDRWTIVSNGDARAAGFFATANGAFLGSENYKSNAANTTGILAVWTATAQYTQKVILAAGNYRLTIPVYNAGGKEEFAKNLFGFIAEDGTEYLATEKKFALGNSTVTIDFALNEETTGVFSLGYTAENRGSDDMPHIFLSGINVKHLSDLYLANETLEAAITAANVKVAPFTVFRGAGLFLYADPQFSGFDAAYAAALAARDSDDADAKNAAAEALVAATEALEPVKTLPTAGTYYTFAQKAGGGFLSLAVGVPVKLAEEATPITFIETEGGYYLADGQGLYVGIDDNYSTSTLASKKAVITVAPVKNGNAFYYTLGESKGLIGSDAPEGAGYPNCYSNKEQNDYSLWTIEETEAPAAVLFTGTEGKYYLKNVESGKYWGVGNSWGTQASLVKNPEYVTLLPNGDGTYKIESQVSNGGNNIYFNGDFMDNGSPVALTIAKVDDYYTIANGDNYFGYDGESTVLGKNLAADAEVALWQIISEEDMLASLATATQEAPVDATFLLSDANFGRNNRYYNAWNFVATNKKNEGDITNYCVESYHSLFTLNQTIENAPAGVYKLTAQGFYRQDGTDNEHLPVFYLNDETATFPFLTGTENSMTDASGAFTAGKYASEPIYIKLAEAGNLSVGAKLEGNTSLWCIWDNFELTYYGKNADVTELKVGALKAQLEELMEEATALAAEPEKLSDQIEYDLGHALETGENVTATTESYQAAIDELTAAIKAANDFIAKGEEYAATMAAIDAHYAILNGTNVYTQEAYDAYKVIIDEWKEKLEAGTLEEKVVNPSTATGWHAANVIDDFLMSAWDETVENWSSYHLNTWSVEGEKDGSEYLVPFIEYWTGDGNSLAEKTLTATITGLESGIYKATVDVRVRIKNDADAPATGITFQVNDGEATNVADGELVEETQFYIKSVEAEGIVGEDGTLKIKFNVAADNNISWLSFKNVNYVRTSDAPALYAITVAETENGTVTASAEKAYEGTTVNFTVTPAEGYEIDVVSVLPVVEAEEAEEPAEAAEADETEVTEEAEEPAEAETAGIVVTASEGTPGEYSFVMPASAVTINVTFKKIAEDIEVPEIANASFEKDGEKAAANGALTITGWTFAGVGTQYNNTEIRPAGSESTTSQFGTSDPSDGEYSLFFRQGWNGGGNTITITSDALAAIPAGNYTLSVDYKQHYSHDGSANSNTKVGIALVNGENTLASETSPAAAGVEGGTGDATYFNDAEWSTLAASFTLENVLAAGAQVVITFNAAGQRRSDFFIDNVQLIQISDEEIALETLKDAIAAAQAQADGYSVGAGLFQYPAEEIAPLTEAIATAQAALDAAESVETVAAAAQTLNDFVAAFAPVISAPKAGQAYLVANATAEGNLNVADGKVTVDTDAQVYFTEVEGGYAISNAEGEYIFKTTENTWTFATTTDIAEAYVVTVNPVEGGYTLQGARGLFGTDKTDAGSTVYANKAQSNNGLWTIEEVVEPEPELVYSDLTRDMYHKWTGVDADAEIAEGTPYCLYEVGNSAGNVYGNSNVLASEYADLSEYKVLVIKATEGTPRLLLNRPTDDSNDYINIPNNAEQTAKYLISTEDGVYTYDLAAIKADYGFVHLNAIKGANWANVTVTSIQLGKVVEPELPLKGDANLNNVVNIVDALIIAGYVSDEVALEDLSEDEQYAVDVDENGAITINDAQQTVNIALGITADEEEEPAAEEPEEPAAEEGGEEGGESKRRATLETTDFLTVENGTISLVNARRYTAFQMYVTVAEGASLKADLAERANALEYFKVTKSKKMPNTYLVVGLSTSATPIEGSEGAILSLDIEGDKEVSISNALFSTVANAYALDVVNGDATGIAGIREGQAIEGGIYTMGGVQVKTLQKGVNIIRMADGSVKKILVK